VWTKCRSFHAAEHLVEVGAAKVTAVHDDSGDLLRVGDIFEGVGGKQHEVGELSFLDGPGPVFDSEKARRIDRRSLQCFERSESRSRETL
jgi:hypothetical protein